MPEIHHCWRCRTEIPMLDEAEWARMAPLLHARIEEIKDHRRAHGVDLKTALKHVSDAPLRLYRELTGYEETNVEAIWHHRLALWGPPCRACGHLLRTPRAGFCAACGTPVRP